MLEWEKVHWQEAMANLSMGRPIKRVFNGKETIFQNRDIFNKVFLIRIADQKSTRGDWFVPVQ